MTLAVIIRAITKYKPTLLLDELDTYLHNEKRELIGILNSGHSRFGSYSMRCVGDQHELVHFDTWSAKVFAAIGKIPPTLVDRSIVISMKRKLPTERVERIPSDPNAYDELRRKCARWVADNASKLKEAKPVVPEALSDRARDNWVPMLAIAEAIGGDWPQLARQAALSLTAKAGDDQSYPILLLEDMKRLFEENDGENLSSTFVVSELAKMETRPWPAFGRSGKPITAHGVNKLLENFRIKSSQVPVEGRRPNGFPSSSSSSSLDTSPKGPPSPLHPLQTAENQRVPGQICFCKKRKNAEVISPANLGKTRRCRRCRGKMAGLARVWHEQATLCRA